MKATMTDPNSMRNNVTGGQYSSTMGLVPAQVAMTDPERMNHVLMNIPKGSLKVRDCIKDDKGTEFVRFRFEDEYRKDCHIDFIIEMDEIMTAFVAMEDGPDSNESSSSSSDEEIEERVKEEDTRGDTKRQKMEEGEI